MPAAPTTPNESKRLAALRSYNILDTATEEDFDELTELASAICSTPIALISFVDKDRQWFKSRHGLDVSETDRALSFCAHAINSPTEILEVENAKEDKRFMDNELVTGPMDITFYAGVPLVDVSGAALGSLCVIDSVQHKLNTIQRKALKILARQVIDKLELRRKVVELDNTRTRIQRLNELLVAKEREATQIIEHTPTAMALHIGEDMEIRFANKMMLGAWGKDERVFGMNFKDALPELDKLDFPTTMRQVYRKGIHYEQKEAHMLYMHYGKLKEFYYNYAFTPLKLSDGSVWGVLNTAVDVTDIVKSRIAVERAEEQLRLAVQSAQLGTWSINADTYEFDASERTKELFGFLPDEVITYEAAVNQITEEYRDKVKKTVEAAIKENRGFDMEYAITGLHNGKLRWVRATGKLYSSGDGKAAQFSGTLSDITERKQDEQRKNDFIGMVSHELKTPLTSMKGYLQIIGQRANKLGDVPIADFTKKTQRQADKMQALVTGFLDVARITEGKIHLNNDVFDINDVMRAAEDELRVNCKGAHITFRLCDSLLINGDKDKMEQVLINFINNAIKYSADEPEVTITCSKDGDNALVIVSDRGIGIPAADIPYIFDRFYRVENTHVKMISGFGIGLYICKEIIEHHGGTIGVKSEPGKGSDFWFSVPLSK